MTTRPEGLKSMAMETGETLVSVTNHARSLTAPEVPAPFNTTLGRGHRHARLNAQWLCSTFLAMVLDDPKNAARRVPACGNLPFGNTHSSERLERYEWDARDQSRFHKRTIVDYSGGTLAEVFGTTLFEVLVNLVESVAENWDGPIHQLLRKEFTLTISLTEPVWAEMRMFVKHDGNEQTTRIYTKFGNRNTEPSSQAAVPRLAVIETRHIEMLAKLYAGTLRHEGALPPSETAPASTTAGAETENAGSLPQEPAPSDRQLSEHVTSDGDKHTQANGPDKPGSKSSVCLSSSAKFRRVGSATHTWRRPHGLEPHHHAPA